MDLKLTGFLGVLILFATILVIGLTTFVSLISFILEKNTKENKVRWSKYFLLSGIFFLLFDGMFYMFLATKRDKSMSQNEGVLFDEEMLYIWIPLHITGYFFVAFILRLVHLKKTRISELLDKIR
jgi:hypothetical protein